MTTTETSGKSRRGFASLSAEQRSAIASLGGRTAHEKGRAHQFTSAEAAEAGRKGGQARAAKRRATAA